jgi:hypothetical protein
MEPQLITFINHPPTSRLATPMLGSADALEDDADSDCLAPLLQELEQDLHTEDIDAEPTAAVLWAAAPSGREIDLTSAVSEADTKLLDSAGNGNHIESPFLEEPLPADQNSRELDASSEAATQPPAQPSPQQKIEPLAKQPAAPSPSSSPPAADNLRARVYTLMDEDDSEEDDTAARRPVLKKFGSVSAGKYKTAVDSDGDDSDTAQNVLVVEPDDDFLEIDSILKKTRPVSAAQEAQAQEAAAAHAEDMWKPISIWSQAKPTSIVKSQAESSVLLSTVDLQLLQAALTSPIKKLSSVNPRPAPEAPAASRMKQLPPDRGRKWPLNRLFSIKAERKAFSGVQLTADDALHLQDIENCIVQGGQITDELRDVRSQLRKLQLPSRASTQLKSSHTVASSELRSMTGDAPQKNPFLPPNYHGRQAATAEEDVPYDCIRLLQSYDTKAGTAQRLHEHDRMMSDL